jgi:hypothetical protein
VILRGYRDEEYVFADDVEIWRQDLRREIRSEYVLLGAEDLALAKAWAQVRFQSFRKHANTEVLEQSHLAGIWRGYVAELLVARRLGLPVPTTMEEEWDLVIGPYTCDVKATRYREHPALIVKERQVRRFAATQKPDFLLLVVVEGDLEPKPEGWILGAVSRERFIEDSIPCTVRIPGRLMRPEQLTDAQDFIGWFEAGAHRADDLPRELWEAL